MKNSIFGKNIHPWSEVTRLSYCGSPRVSALLYESREAREERSALATGAFLSTANVAITAATTLSTPKLNRLLSFSATLEVRWKMVTRCA